MRLLISQTREPSVNQIIRIGMDTSKHFFQLHGVDAAERPVLRRKLRDRKSTRLNSSHTEIYTLSLHDALPISVREPDYPNWNGYVEAFFSTARGRCRRAAGTAQEAARSEEHTSELQSHRDLHSFPTRRSSDLRP